MISDRQILPRAGEEKHTGPAPRRPQGSLGS